LFAKRFEPFGTTIFSEMTRLAEEHGAINLAQGFPDFDAPEMVLEAAAQALHSGKNQYARSMGHPPLVETLAEKYKTSYSLSYDPYGEIVTTNGATEAIASAFLGLLNPGDEVVFFEPHYDSYPACASMAGAVSRFCTLKFPDFKLDMNVLESCLTVRTRILFINTPHNPTGKIFSKEELDELASICIRRNLVVITDEVYEHITYEGAEHVPIASLPGMRERTITISGAGKTFSMTGWRVGWAAGPHHLIAALQRAHQYVTFAPATPLQEALGKVLRSIGDEYYNDLRADYTARRSLLLQVLQELGLRPASPAGTYYILADFTDIWQGDDRSFVEHLIEQCGVAAIPPSSFYSAHPEEGKKLVRFAFCKKRDTLEAAARRLRQLGG
jgi:aspartate/methionine/tyrosine aminotransferase